MTLSSSHGSSRRQHGDRNLVDSTSKNGLSLTTRSWIATEPTAPLVAASSMVWLRRHSLTTCDSTRAVRSSSARIDGQCPSLNSRDTESSTTTRHNPVRTEGRRWSSGMYSPESLRSFENG